MNFPIFPSRFLLNFRILSPWYGGNGWNGLYQHEMAFLWRAIEILLTINQETIYTRIYRDEIAFDIYLCFHFFFFAFAPFPWLFSKHWYLRTPFLQFSIHRRVRALSVQMSDSFFSIFFQHSASKAPAGISFKSILVLRDFQRVLQSWVRFIGFSCVFLIFVLSMFYFCSPFIRSFLWFCSNKRVKCTQWASSWSWNTYNFMFLWCIICAFIAAIPSFFSIVFCMSEFVAC